jgi:hypothetical protein
MIACQPCALSEVICVTKIPEYSRFEQGKIAINIDISVISFNVLNFSLRSVNRHLQWPARMERL